MKTNTIPHRVFAEDPIMILWLGLLPKAIQIIQTESFLKLLERTQIRKKMFWSWNKIPGNRKIQNTNKPTAAICGLRQMIDHARATSAAAAAAARCVWSMLYGSHAKAVNRRHRRAMCSVRVQSSKHDKFFRWPVASAAEKEQHTEHPRQHAAVIDKAHGGIIDVASAPF